MKNDALQVGLRHSRTITVSDELTVPQLPRAIGAMEGMPPVLASAYMIALIEATCIEALAAYLPEGQKTVGVHVNVAHTTPTPVGLAVTASVVLTAIEGRCLRFQVECYDDKEAISNGTHDRIIIDTDRFERRLVEKREKGV